MKRRINNIDISMIMENIKFNYRVGVLLEHNGKILIEQSDNYPFAVIPGGRVKLLEDTNLALVREIKEEIGINIDNLDGKLISIIENFFVLDDIQYHELYFVYKYHLDSDFGIIDGMRNQDSLKSKYYWKDINELEHVELLPVQLKEIVKLEEFKKFVVRS